MPPSPSCPVRYDDLIVSRRRGQDRTQAFAVRWGRSIVDDLLRFLRGLAEDANRIGGGVVEGSEELASAFRFTGPNGTVNVIGYHPSYKSLFRVRVGNEIYVVDPTSLEVFLAAAGKPSAAELLDTLRKFGVEADFIQPAEVPALVLNLTGDTTLVDFVRARLGPLAAFTPEWMVRSVAALLMDELMTTGGPLDRRLIDALDRASRVFHQTGDLPSGTLAAYLREYMASGRTALPELTEALERVGLYNAARTLSRWSQLKRSGLAVAVDVPDDLRRMLDELAESLSEDQLVALASGDPGAYARLPRETQAKLQYLATKLQQEGLSPAQAAIDLGTAKLGNMEGPPVVLNVSLTGSPVWGEFWPAHTAPPRGTITLNPMIIRENGDLITIAHELVHYLQDRTGWPIDWEAVADEVADWIMGNTPSPPTSIKALLDAAGVTEQGFLSAVRDIQRRLHEAVRKYGLKFGKKGGTAA